MTLCTAIIPSRGRIDQLFRCIDSIIQSASGDDYQIHVRLDDNDDSSLARVSELEAYPVVKVEIGNSPGWSGLDQVVYGPVANASQSTWVWILNDDMTIKAEGNNWDDLLREVPTTGYWCEPEFHQLNDSVYENDERSCAPLFRTRCWRDLGVSQDLPSPCDYVLVDILKNRGWKPWFLKGLRVWHQRNKP